MDLPINTCVPRIMHVDLNSAFATLEQQASPHLRGKPIVVAAYDSPGGCVLAASIEAKKFGIKTGMRVMEARMICPTVLVRTPTPVMYRDAHIKFRKIFTDYTPDVVPKSIDEAVLDFSDVDTQALFRKSLTDIAYEIKRRIRKEIGDWVSCNVGIGANRFLAKTAASLHKPDGLDVITGKNLKQVYDSLELLDLCGINYRFKARLNAYGIFTPIQFLEAPLETLKKKVFRSICGYYWFLRLRGWEIDKIDFERKSYGQSYAIGKKSSDPKYLSSLLMKLTEKMGRRLRKAGKTARGVHLGFSYIDGTYWHKGKLANSEMFTTDALFKKVMLLFHMQPEIKAVTHIDVRCFKLSGTEFIQESLFEGGEEKKREVSKALDRINDCYGEYTIVPLLMKRGERDILDRIAFGNVKELEEIYAM
jgi:DNA polymerase-4